MSGALGQRGVVLATTAGLLLALSPWWPLGVWGGTGLAATLGLSGAYFTAQRELGPLVRLTGRRLAAGVLAGVLMAAVTHALYPLMVRLLPGLGLEAQALYARLDAPPGRLAALPIVLLVVVAEEVVFRGLAYGQLRRRFPPHFAAGLSLVLYLVPQALSGSWLLPLLALVCGAVWTAQRVRTGNLVVPTVTHLVWDLLVMVAVPLV